VSVLAHSSLTARTSRDKRAEVRYVYDFPLELELERCLDLDRRAQHKKHKSDLGTVTMTATSLNMTARTVALVFLACFSIVSSIPMQMTINQRGTECLYDKLEAG
jgi:hypothetical protein